MTPLLTSLAALSLALSSLNTSLATTTVPATVPGAIDHKAAWMEALAQCESGGRDAIRVLDSNGRYSYGRYQFQMATWLAYGAPFGATRENIYDGELQERVAEAMLDAGQQKRWFTCSKKIRARLGEYPQAKTAVLKYAPTAGPAFSS